MKFLIGLFSLLFSSIVLASNFGDLPSVLPFFGLALVISFFVAIAKAMKSVEGSKDKKFHFFTYFLYQVFGIVLSFVLIVVLWLGTL